MAGKIVLTLTGPDRVGIVEELTGLLLDLGGNVETSRMARLSGEFAVLMLVSLPSSPLADLDALLDRLVARGYKTSITRADLDADHGRDGWLPFRIEVHGADHEGIIHQVARYLSTQGISIESMESRCTPAPTSGAPLFDMVADVVVPPALSTTPWQAGLSKVGENLNLDIDVQPSGDF